MGARVMVKFGIRGQKLMRDMVFFLPKESRGSIASHLGDSGRDVAGVGRGHRLAHDRVLAAQLDVADIHRPGANDCSKRGREEIRFSLRQTP